jgi:hypothetical protein
VELFARGAERPHFVRRKRGITLRFGAVPCEKAVEITQSTG